VCRWVQETVLALNTHPPTLPLLMAVLTLSSMVPLKTPGMSLSRAVCVAPAVDAAGDAGWVRYRCSAEDVECHSSCRGRQARATGSRASGVLEQPGAGPGACCGRKSCFWSGDRHEIRAILSCAS
jgi:hypothetical protein